MKKRIDKFLPYLLMFLLGVMSYGMVLEVVKAISSRENGNYGGEIFILPLIAGCIYIGYMLAKGGRVK